MEKAYTLYILTCGSKAIFYTGITSNLEKRLRTHQLEDRCSIYDKKQWTRFHQPVQLVFKYEGMENLAIALRVEKYIKAWKRQWKEMLINGDEFSLNLLEECHKKKRDELLSILNTSSHVPQIPNPYTVHIQK